LQNMWLESSSLSTVNLLQFQRYLIFPRGLLFWRALYVITIHQRHRQTDWRTDGQTDKQTTCDRNTALCTKVHRAVKTDQTFPI